jgi:hypothetical protein
MTFDPHGRPAGFRSAPAVRLPVNVWRFSKATRVTLGVAIVVVFGGAIAIVNIFPGHGKHDPIGLVMILAALISLGLIAVIMSERATTLDVTGDELVIDGGLAGRFPRAGARLAAWTMPDGTRRGSALLLGGGAPFTLGGLGHTPIAAPTDSVRSVDAYLSAEHFEALLAEVPVAAAIAPSGSRRCPLAAGPAGMAAIVPWIAAMVGAAALGAVRGALDDVFGPPGIAFVIALGAILAAGLGATVVVSLRRTGGPQAWLELDQRGVRVSDRAGRVLLEAPPNLLVARPLTCTYRGRGSFVMPVVALAAPGFAEVTIGVREFAVGWPGPVPSTGSPRFVIGGADWAALLERLRLGAAIAPRR